jgi:hypothetical protein
MKLWICLFAVLCFTGIVRAQVPAEYPDVPLDNQSYADLKIWSGKDTDSYCCFSDPVKNPCQLTRYEFAVAVARAIESYSFPSGKGKQGKPDYEFSIAALIQGRTPQELAALARLVAEFKPDLQQLGIAEQQIEFAQKELAARVESTPSPKLPIAAPFRDVPKTHWAFEAVERLRQSGIVIGTPDGAFAK